MPNRVYVRENDWGFQHAKNFGCYKTLFQMEKVLSSESPNPNKPWTFKLYEVDELSKSWRCKYLEESLIKENLTMPSMSLYGTYQTMEDIKNKHINISLKGNEYYVHPGTQRYLLNCIENNFKISSLLIDYDCNDEKILKDFPSAKVISIEDLDFHVHKSGDNYSIKLNSGWSKIESWQEYAIECYNFYDLAVPNSDHSVNIFLDKRHLMSYDNEKPEMNVYVDDIYGWAKFIIDYYCERKLTYNGYQTDI